jgi:GDP-L-fucose synthase
MQKQSLYNISISDIRSKRVAITGGKGFLGKHLIKKMRDYGYDHIYVADCDEYDLTTLEDVQRMYGELKPDIVIHLAARVGGIGFNQENPATLFYDNLMMGAQLLHEGHLRNIDKFVAIGTICAYPKFTPVPFREDDIWNGYPEETNAPYGLAKKMMLVQSQAYRKQYGFNSIFLLPVNLYGPGDNFDFRSSHVIPALIRKFCLATFLSEERFDLIERDLDRFGAAGSDRSDYGKAGDHNTSIEEKVIEILKGYGISKSRSHGATVEVWGTGNVTREFFYVEDAAGAIMLATEQYNKSEPVNIGAGFEILICDLAELVVELTGFSGGIDWNKEKPDGQPRRMLDTSKAFQEFGFKAQTDFREGLKKTIEWYRNTVIGSHL